MNHDYAHCLDCKDDCPEECFRAQLVRDLKNYPYPVSWMHLEDTEECQRNIPVDKYTLVFTHEHIDASGVPVRRNKALSSEVIFAEGKGTASIAFKEATGRMWRHIQSMDAEE